MGADGGKNLLMLVQHLPHLLFTCLMLVCKPKAAVVAFQNYALCVGVLWTCLGALSKMLP
jgi:hypothetical protein